MIMAALAVNTTYMLGLTESQVVTNKKTR